MRNELTGALFDTVLTTSQEPLLLKNCPHIMNDSIYMDIRVGQMNNSDGQLKFTGGDPVVISAAVLWARNDATFKDHLYPKTYFLLFVKPQF